MSTQPAAFVAHGSPLAALARDAYAAALERFGAALERPRAVVVLSAHWQSRGPVAIGSGARHETIHDFSGFPPELHAIRYDAPGDPALAGEVAAALKTAGFAVELDPRRGLDHGAWVPLRLIFPGVDVPVVPVSLPIPRDAAALLRLGAALAPLRRAAVLLLGSGGIVHNLGEISPQMSDGRAEPWAASFDGAVAAAIASDPSTLARWASLPEARRAAPTSEHFDPLLAVIGARLPGDQARTLHAGFHHRNISMRSIAFLSAQPAAA